MRSHNDSIDTTHTPPPLSFYNTFKGLSLDGGQADFSKKAATTLTLIKIYRTSLILTGSISLDSTFKRRENLYLLEVLLNPDRGGGMVQKSYSRYRVPYLLM